MAVRVRVWLLLGAIVLGLGFGFLGRATDVQAFNVLSGLLWLAALVLGVSLLPFWKRVLPEVPPMPGLFDRVHEGQRWCVQCGSPTPQEGPCQVCKASVPSSHHGHKA